MTRPELYWATINATKAEIFVDGELVETRTLSSTEKLGHVLGIAATWSVAGHKKVFVEVWDSHDEIPIARITVDAAIRAKVHRLDRQLAADPDWRDSSW